MNVEKTRVIDEFISLRLEVKAQIFLDTSTGFSMVKVPVVEGGIDRKYFCRPRVKIALEKLGIKKIEKVNCKIAPIELVKFLLLKEVESPLANVDAEDFLEEVRKENKPVERGEISEK